MKTFALEAFLNCEMQAAARHWSLRAATTILPFPAPHLAVLTVDRCSVSGAVQAQVNCKISSALYICKVVFQAQHLALTIDLDCCLFCTSVLGGISCRLPVEQCDQSPTHIQQVLVDSSRMLYPKNGRELLRELMEASLEIAKSWLRYHVVYLAA